MSFEEFTGRRQNNVRSMVVSVTGALCFAIAADVIEALDSPEYVVLLFDREARAAAVKAAPVPQPDWAFKVIRAGRHYSVSAKRFCQVYGICAAPDLPVTIEDGIAVFELPKEQL